MGADWTAGIPAFVVTLREGFEAALVVGIVLASLAKASGSALNRWVWLGILAGLGASAAVGTVLVQGIQALDRSQQVYAPLFKELLETGLGITAVILLGWMLVWMTQQARSLSGEIKAAVTDAINASSNTAGWGIFAIVAIAVLREGFETVIFLAAQFQEGAPMLLGAIAGIGSATILGILLFRWSIRIDIARFFKVMGIILLVIIGSLTVSALKHANGAALVASDLHLANLCWSAPSSCILGPQLWDLSAVLSDRQFPGLLFKTLLGYRDHLYLFQAIAYLGVLITIGQRYFRSLSPTSVKPSAQSSPQN
ncbi:MAG: FTR1 family protein [Cyanobacteria bacterium P01_H01_bin.130]